MKRDKKPRRLHMGCGEALIARMYGPSRQPIKTVPVVAIHNRLPSIARDKR